MFVRIRILVVGHLAQERSPEAATWWSLGRQQTTELGTERSLEDFALSNIQQICEGTSSGNAPVS